MMEGHTPNNRDLYYKLGEVCGVQDILLHKINAIENRLSNLEKMIADIKSDIGNMYGKTSILGTLVAAITSVLISLGLKKA